MVLFKIVRAIVILIVCNLILLLFPDFSSDVKYESFPMSVAVPVLDRQLSDNTSLANMQRWLVAMVAGPESVAVWRGAVYTGVHGGLVVRVHDSDRYSVIASLGPDCDSAERMDVYRCGRPLGMRFHGNGLLYVADAYLGVFSVNVSDGVTVHIVRADEQVESAGVLRLFNDVQLDAQGRYVYFTCSSAVSDLHFSYVELLSAGSGRLLRFDLHTGRLSVLMSGLNFANGLALSEDEHFLLVAETGRFRVHKYWLQGSEAGSSQVIADNLPGFPDNIRLHHHRHQQNDRSNNRDNDNHHFSVGMCNLRQHATVIAHLRSHWLLSRYMVRVASLLAAPFSTVNRLWPNIYCHTVLYKLLTLESMSGVLARGGGGDGAVLRLSSRGHFTGASVHVPHVRCASQLTEHDGAMMVGSPFSKFLGYASTNGH